MSKGKQAKFDLFIGAVNNFSRPWGMVEKSLQSGQEKLKKLRFQATLLAKNTGLDKFTSGLGNLGAKFKGLLGNLSIGVTAIGAGLAALGAGAFSLTQKVANAGDEAYKMAQKAGLSTEAWQEYNHAADMSGVSSEKLQRAFSKLSGITLKAASGGKEAALWFKRAGISFKDSNGKLKSGEVLFSEVAEKIKKLNESGQKMKALELSKAFFGKGGTELMPLLNAGAAGLKDMRQEAQDLGIVIDEKTAKSAEEFNDNISRAKAVVWGLGVTLGSKLMPYIDRLVVGFKNWFIANKSVINSKIKEWVEKLQAKLEKLQAKLPEIKEELIKIGKKVWEFGKKFKEVASFLGWENTLAIGLGALAAVIAGPLVASFITLGITMLTTPVGWVLLGITALIAAGYALYKNWDKICGFFKAIFADIKAAFQRSWLDGIVHILKNFSPLGLVKKGLDGLCKHFKGLSLREYGTQLVESFKAGFIETWEAFKAFALGKVKWLADLVPDWLKGGVKRLGEGAMQGYGAGRGATFGPALGAQGLAQNAPSSTHTEKQELKVKLELPEGIKATMLGQTPENVNVQSSANNGLLMGHF